MIIRNLRRKKELAVARQRVGQPRRRGRLHIHRLTAIERQLLSNQQRLQQQQRMLLKLVSDQQDHNQVGNWSTCLLITKSIEILYWILASLMYLVFMAGSILIIGPSGTLWVAYTVAWLLVESLLGWLLHRCLKAVLNGVSQAQVDRKRGEG